MRTIACARFVSFATASKIGLQRKEDDHGESGYGRLEPYIQFPPQAQTYELAYKGPEAKPQVFLYCIGNYAGCGSVDK